MVSIMAHLIDLLFKQILIRLRFAAISFHAETPFVSEFFWLFIFRNFLVCWCFVTVENVLFDVEWCNFLKILLPLFK